MSDLVQRHRAAADSHRRRKGNAHAALCKLHDDTAEEIERLRKCVEIEFRRANRLEAENERLSAVYDAVGKLQDSLSVLQDKGDT